MLNPMIGVVTILMTSSNAITRRLACRLLDRSLAPFGPSFPRGSKASPGELASQQQLPRTLPSLYDRSGWSAMP
jgi:hypothetical protein